MAWVVWQCRFSWVLAILREEAMTSNQFTFLIFILLLGFGGYLSHPLFPPEAGLAVVVIGAIVIVGVLCCVGIYELITWPWREWKFRKECRRLERKERLMNLYNRVDFEWRLHKLQLRDEHSPSPQEGRYPVQK